VSTADVGLRSFIPSTLCYQTFGSAADLLVVGASHGSILEVSSSAELVHILSLAVLGDETTVVGHEEARVEGEHSARTGELLYLEVELRLEG
jgi:hypothetical protein